MRTVAHTRRLGPSTITPALSRAGSSLLVGLALCAPSRSAHADPAAEARFHDDLARKQYDGGQFEAAVREFFLEQRAAPNPRISFNIALCFEELKRDEDSFLYFSEYLASDDKDPDRRAHAEDAVKKLESRVARVLVKSTTPGADILVDQREHGSYGKTPRVVAMPAGDHRVSVDLPGYRSAEVTVSAKKGVQAEIEVNLVRIVGALTITSPVPGTAEVRTAAGEKLASGATPLSASVPPGTYEIGLSAKGYLPWTGVATVEADKATSTAAAPLPAPTETGDITVTSNVRGALVELDGQPAGFSPTILPTVSVGRHTLRTRAPSLLPWSGEVNVASDQREWVTVSLEPPAAVQRSSATWVVGGLGVASLGAAGVFAILASKAHSDFNAASPETDRANLRDRGVTLNTTADVLLVTGAIALGSAIVLYFTSAETKRRDSSASIARSAR
jgi:outer membrane receptor for ferrienterochelin and colicins